MFATSLKDPVKTFRHIKTEHLNNSVSANDGKVGKKELLTLIFNKKLRPPLIGFQKSEFLLEKGFLDFVVHRKNLKNKISNFIKLVYYSKKEFKGRK